MQRDAQLAQVAEEAIIDGFAAYGQTTSSVMQSAPVPRRGLAPRGPR